MAIQSIVEMQPVHADCFPFSALPHTNRLFADYCADFRKVQNFYSRGPRFTEWAGQRASSIIYDPKRRGLVAEILERQNRAWGASEATIRNLARLRQGAQAMVTGQQVALFGGPLYAIFKALTAIKFGEELTRAGTDCVPIFWLATEDHDFAEVSGVTFYSSGSGLVPLRLEANAKPNQPVSTIRLGEPVRALTEQAAKLFGSAGIASTVQSSYAPDETLGSAFAKLFTQIFAKFGLIVLDPSDPELHHVARPVYRAAIEKSDRILESLLARGAQIEAAGYEPQVKVTNSSTLLFCTQANERLPIRRVNGSFMVSGEKVRGQGLGKLIDEHPESFSPNVLLRPVVQDYLLPTVAYIGGPSEIAYFAQAGVVYQELLGSVTPILPRFSGTLIDPKSRRIMEQYRITFPNVFEGPEHLREHLAQQHLPQELDVALEHTRRLLDENLASIVAQLKKLDPTLVDAAEKSVGKMEYQLEHLRKKAAQAQLRRKEELKRHADHLSSTIYPNKNLQEREIAGVCFLAQHGPTLLDSIYEAIQPACVGHQLLHI
jgi:bacillithiol biosynthesis cysteine-adding enzyme BshC